MILSQNKLRLLLVNASGEMNKLLVETLRTIGFSQVSSARGEEEAMQRMREQPAQIVITGWNVSMHGLRATHRQADESLAPGYQFVRKLRDETFSPDPFVPVILLADPMTTREAIAARDSGVNSVVLKPLKAEQLCHCVREVIARPRMFIAAPAYRGPCRRTQRAPLKDGMPERRGEPLALQKRAVA